MLYGDPYGGLYGGPRAFVEDHGRAALLRLPDISRTAGMETALAILGERWQALDFALQKIQPWLLWDFTTAAGVWLDMIGEFLGVPRDGREDPYYRRVLSAYALIVYPARRTTDGLLKALIALVGDAASVSFEPAYPKGFVVEIAGLSVDAMLNWDAIKILELGTPATYRRQIVIDPAGALLGDDATGTVTVSNPMTLDDATGTVTVTDAGVCAWVY